jgi:diadenosine tetraphosphate (Ap4A) HIT family hydrolase
MKRTVIHDRVDLANNGKFPQAICRLKSGWVVMADTQPVEGYCILLSDPVAPDLNSLNEIQRTQYCLDMIRIGDAILKATGAFRINYETWGNVDPALHTHVVPRYMSEPDDKRRAPICKSYDIPAARKFDLEKDGRFISKMRELLGAT